MASSCIRQWDRKECRARLVQVARKRTAVDVESPGEDRYSHIAVREALDISGRQQLRKAESILRSIVDNAVCYQAADLTDLYAQNGGRLAIIYKALWRYFDVWRWAVLPQILRQEQIPGDPTKPVGVSGRHKTTVNDGAYDSGKGCAMAEVILHRVAQRYELTRFE